MNLQDVVLVFHEPDCPGLIVSDDNGRLACSECAESVGKVDPRVLSQLIAVLEQVPAK